MDVIQVVLVDYDGVVIIYVYVDVVGIVGDIFLDLVVGQGVIDCVCSGGNVFVVMVVIGVVGDFMVGYGVDDVVENCIGCIGCGVV